MVKLTYYVVNLDPERIALFGDQRGHGVAGEVDEVGVAEGAGLIAFGALALSRTTQFESWPNGLSAGQVALLAAYAAFMLGVCLLACVVPTRRALRVEPIVAMRVE